MTEKPLHVRVAEALGHGHIEPCDGELWHFEPGSGAAYRPDFNWIWRDMFDSGDWHRCDHEQNIVPPYGEDSPEGWAATGPLIHKFDIEVGPTYSGLGEAAWYSATAGMREYHEGEEYARGASMPEAACNLIIALSEAGRLPK